MNYTPFIAIICGGLLFAIIYGAKMARESRQDKLKKHGFSVSQEKGGYVAIDKKIKFKEDIWKSKASRK